MTTNTIQNVLLANASTSKALASRNWIFRFSWTLVSVIK